MSLNFNLLNSTCIKSIQELNDFTRKVQSMRIAMSYYNFTDIKSDEFFSNWFRDSIKIALYIIIIVIALIGNILIILVICFNRFMKKPTNYFMLNLAICDLAIVLSCMWVQIVMTIKRFWVLGEIFCKLNSFMQMMSIIASVLTLATISCDRYFGIAHPLKARVKSRSSYCYILSIWIISFLISIPSFIYRTYTERKWSDFIEQHCDDLGWPRSLIKNSNGCANKITMPLKRIYYTTVILLLFFLPIFIMSITYSILIFKLWKSEVLGETYFDDKKVILKKRKKVIVMLIWILVIYFICWSPLESMLLFMEYSDQFPSWWSDLEWVSYFMAYSNTAINPFIYAGFSENYKLGIRRLKERLFRNSSFKSNNLLLKTNISIQSDLNKKSYLTVNRSKYSSANGFGSSLNKDFV